MRCLIIFTLILPLFGCLGDRYVMIGRSGAVLVRGINSLEDCNNLREFLKVDAVCLVGR